LRQTDVGRHAKKTTLQIETLTYKNRHKWTQTDIAEGHENKKADRFVFLIISPTAHLADLQSRTIQPTTQALQKSQILPTLIDLN